MQSTAIIAVYYSYIHLIHIIIN
uniref:Uncharacterized protein n=1 Tax=Anguilla anguilla TaxID=7936 RepID=A0A0E9TWI7_ANGAN